MKIHHIAITVKSIKESVDFYVNIFGFVVVKKFERRDMKAKAVFIELDGFYIEIWQFDDVKEANNILNDIKVLGIRHIAFEVNNLENVIVELRQKGLKFSKPMIGASGHNYSFTTDPNGIALEFYEKKSA
jgi:glyoxylase I family protein